MKIHRPLREALLSAWQSTFSDNHHAEKVLERLFKTNRRFGARDRRFVAEYFFDGVRWWRPLVEDVRGRWDDHDPALSPAQCEQVLERLISLKENASLADEFAGRPRASAQSIPDWLDALGEKALGAAWEPTLKAMNSPAPVFLRVNGLKNTREELLELLRQEEVAAEAVVGVPSAVKLRERKNVFQTECYRQGRFEMQDAGSQLIAPFTQAQPKARVIDACAGAGGKSLHLAELMKNSGRIVAMDIHEWKLKELRTRAARAGVDTIETRVIAGTKDIKRYENSADYLLLDVPCSGLGVIRRHPDTKWKLTPKELAELARTQTEILEKYPLMLKRGGLLIYATCSILPEENGGRVREFLAQHKHFTLEEELTISPMDTEFDGFYAARIRKN